MAEEIDLATAIAIEVAKQIPVRDTYDDLAKPAARQIGMLAEDIAKTIRLVFAPFQIAAALQDKLRPFLDKSVGRVAEDNRLPPPPQILGPILEGIRYEPEDSPISEMFSQLLSTSMDQTRAHDAHPAFSQIIKQLSPDEAALLNAMWALQKREGRSFRQQFTQDYDRKSNRFGPVAMEIDEIPRDGLVFPENIEFYGQHLYALGVTAFYDATNQEPIFDKDEHGNSIQTGIRMFKELRFTDVGRKFMMAVSP
ncbi:MULTISPECIES: DUF4393 domain-containing protein [Rhizobium]|uniref:DUF4393 domain-containing protein n=1 Tax=Rhizobium tropici TaxID=398 RepID=A0A329YN97_RHITR|nr:MULTISPECIES: DUF4393 domain-containing protein [Rhizobium]MBB3288447.1 hypothetical protein [Rhizobium sp. BK252]MBB3403416.1 hypothetical protein [Rhizobium sp. BK289]MBB3415991.1 hypothetical protein [Rhizobium sp. BK284]MBB3483879.1 hypothetical protein [Rhizobium sp. BK347]MDK4722142.1 DUF4393 domain-containing protein [Rhizobium sp. CNPSo 3968]